VTGQLADQLAAYARVLDWVTRNEAIVHSLAALYLKAFKVGGTLYFCGNGGSAADAQHVAAEYVGRFKRHRRPALRAMALTTDTSILTSVGNDFGFEEVFTRQIEALIRPGDLVVFHSTSGRSLNLLHAALWLQGTPFAKWTPTVALLGSEARCGDCPLRELVTHPILVDAEDTAAIQIGHMMLQHLVIELVEAELAAADVVQ
jgi:D-sedoheptulose 7-phosphate isomerase